jgi:hypothetical protein
MHYWYAYCAVCGRKDHKRDLDRLKVCEGPYGQPITFAYVHPDCLPAVAEFLDVDVPDYRKKSVLWYRTENR